MEENKKRQIRGALSCHMITIWIFFIINFLYLAIFHGLFRLYINLYELFIDVVLLFSLESIGILITLSNGRNNYCCFMTSLIISLFNGLIIIFYILIVIFTLFVTKYNDNENYFLRPHYINTEDTGIDSWVGIVLIVIKVINLIPVIILIIFKFKIDSSVGSINPQAISGEIIENNDKDELV